MKKLSFALAIMALSFSLFSCKKDTAKNAATYYIKGKKDGTAFSFSTNALAMITDNTGGSTSLNLIAGGTALEGFNLGINFFNSTTIQAGSFSEENTNSDYLVAGVYNPNSTTTVNAAGIQSPSIKPLLITILTKSSTEITGTFEGAFYREDITTGTMYTDYVLITEGEFKLKLQ